MTRIAVLISGGGTNLQSLIDAQTAGMFEDGEIVLVLSSKQKVFAIQRAADNGIPSVIVARKDYHNLEDYDGAMRAELDRYHVDLVVLAGFLSILGPKVLGAYGGRILNIHPALIPSFCGKGFYGLHVHKAALDYGVKVTGATVHFVNEVVDGGKIVLQKAVDVMPDDTPESLQLRVMEDAEHIILPQAVAMYCRGEIRG
ncbi:phosphoribosylglycinamide formyltransferase [Ruminococcaceae bacterium OttesenSCG-928-L11]|nr:phosphoribosylglycinamide formyltransferase [Ruminococcaceae bacterium OttesenSCG-928-L11]